MTGKISRCLSCLILCAVIILSDTSMVSVYASPVLIYRTTANLNLRTAPSTEVASFGVLPNGTYVQLIEYINEEWYRVLTFSGAYTVHDDFVGWQEGYMASEFLEPLFEPLPLPANKSRRLYDFFANFTGRFGGGVALRNYDVNLPDSIYVALEFILSEWLFVRGRGGMLSYPYYGFAEYIGGPRHNATNHNWNVPVSYEFITSSFVDSALLRYFNITGFQHGTMTTTPWFGFQYYHGGYYYAALAQGGYLTTFPNIYAFYDNENGTYSVRIQYFWDDWAGHIGYGRYNIAVIQPFEDSYQMLYWRNNTARYASIPLRQPTPVVYEVSADPYAVYIHTPIQAVYTFTPAAATLSGVSDPARAQAAIQAAAASLTPAQRASAYALNNVTLYIENIMRRGTSKNMPGNINLDIAALQELTDTAQSIRQSTDSILESEDISLMRNLRSNINIISDEQAELQISFPDDISGAEFDNITIEAEFAAVTINRDFISSDSRITVRQGEAEQYEDSEYQEAALTGGGLTGVLTNGDVLSDIRNILPVVAKFWGAAVIILMAAAWFILAKLGKKLRLWVVPTFTVVIIAANAGTLFLSGTLPEIIAPNAPEPAGETTIFANMPDEPEYGEAVEGVEVSMTEGMRVTLSLPVNGANPEFLVLVDENDRIQHSKFNPVTETIDARIRTGGVYSLRENRVSFADIEGRSQIMQAAILQLAAREIMQGTADGYFNPDAPISRAEFISAIVRAFDMLDFEAQASFTDISAEDWYYHAVATAERENLISGFEDNTFRAALEIPKDQLIVTAANTLAEQMGYHVPEDVEYFLARFLDRMMLAAWSDEGIALATAANVVIHRSDSMFVPQSVKTRGDAAVVLHRVFERVW